jgi:hypothetical protein
MSNKRTGPWAKYNMAKLDQHVEALKERVSELSGLVNQYDEAATAAVNDTILIMRDDHRRIMERVKNGRDVATFKDLVYELSVLIDKYAAVLAAMLGDKHQTVENLRIKRMNTLERACQEPEDY